MIKNAWLSIKKYVPTFSVLVFSTPAVLVPCFQSRVFSIPNCTAIRCAQPHDLELLAGRPPRTAGLYESFRQGLRTWLFSSY